MKLTISMVILDGPMKDQKFSGPTSESCFKQAQAAGHTSGKLQFQINGIAFPLCACDSITSIVKNKKGVWVLAPMPKSIT